MRHRQARRQACTQQPAPEPPCAARLIAGQQIGIDEHPAHLNTRLAQQVEHGGQPFAADDHDRVAAFTITSANAQMHNFQRFTQLIFHGVSHGLGFGPASRRPWLAANPTAQFHGQQHINRLPLQCRGRLIQWHRLTLTGWRPQDAGPEAGWRVLPLGGQVKPSVHRGLSWLLMGRKRRCSTVSCRALGSCPTSVARRSSRPSRVTCTLIRYQRLWVPSP
ncbi:hypothetical protein D9M69_441460 [compost metagenome]